MALTHGGPRGIRLLIVEHDRHTIEELRDLFAAEGLECEVALNLLTARRILRERRMDVCVVDASAEDFSQKDVILELKPKYPEMKLVIFNGVKDKTQQRQMRKLGADSYLSEGSDLAAVVRAVDRGLQRA